MLKRILSIVVILTMLAGVIPAVGFAADLSSVGAELICDNMSDVGCFGGGHYESNGLVVNTDTSVPVEKYMTHTNLNDQGATGVRHVNTKKYFQTTEGEYIVASYWIKAFAPDGSTADANFSATLNFTHQSKFASLGSIRDIENSGTFKIKPGVWYKKYQIFEVDRTTIAGETTKNVANAARLWISTGKITGQTTFVGDLKMYRFPASFAFGGLEGADAIKEYISGASLEAAYIGGNAIEGFSPDVYSYDLGDADAMNVTVSTASAFADVVTDGSSNGTFSVKVSSYPYNGGTPVEANSASVTVKTYTFKGAAVGDKVKLVQGDMATVVGYGANLYTTTGLVTETDPASPVSKYYTHTRTASGGTGIRHNAQGQFKVFAGDYIVASYWVKIDAPEGTEGNPMYKGYFQYTNGTSGKKPINDINNSKDTFIESGKWYKRTQIFLATNDAQGTYVKDGEVEKEFTAIRFVAESQSTTGQTLYIGDVKAYIVSADFTYCGKTGADAIAEYIADGDVNAITVDGEAIEGFDASRTEYGVCHGDDAVISATADSIISDVKLDKSESGKTLIKVSTYPYNNGVPVAYDDASIVTKTYTVNQVPLAENIMNSLYSLDKWQVGGSGFIVGGKAELVEDFGEPAMMYDADDVKYVTDSQKKSSQFRAQLVNEYFDGEENWKAGDKLYIKFMARAESRYGNSTTGGFVLDKVSKTTNGSQGSMSSTARFEFTGAWKQYYAIININEALPQDCYVRFRLDCGYYGQTTYIKDFEAYFCHGENDEVINYIQNNEEIVNMTKGKVYALSGAGSGDKQLGLLETYEVTDAPVELGTAYKFTSSDYNNTSNTQNNLNNYKARLNYTNIYSQSADVGDKILITFWAKGEYNGTEEGEVAYMRPELQASVNGSGGKSTGYLTAEGVTSAAPVAVSSEWTRYAYVFSVPSGYGNEIQFNWYIGKTNQSVTFADAQVYNFGTKDFDTIVSYFDNNDGIVLYRTKPMKENGNVLEAIASENVSTVEASDFVGSGSYDFVNYKIESIPVAGGANGLVKFVAIDGTIAEKELRLFKSLKDAVNEATTASDVEAVLKLYETKGEIDLTNIGTFADADALYTLIAEKADFASKAEIQTFIDEYMQPYMVAELEALDIVYTLDNNLYCGYGDITVADVVAAAKVSEGASIKAYEYDGTTEADTSKLAHEGIKLVVTAANGNFKNTYCLGYAKYAEYSPLAAFGTDEEGNETFTTEFSVKSYVADEKSYYVIAAEYSSDALVGFDVKTLTVNGADTFTAIASVKTTDSANNTFKSMVFEAGSVKPLRKAVVINKSMAGANVLSFGDSITGSYEPGYPTYMAGLLGTNSYNGGIGGTTLSYAASDSPAYISMVKVSEFISNPEYNFADTDAFVSTLGKLANERYTNVLKKVEVADMDYITILFGTNDYSQNKLLDNADNKYDVTTIKGAARYAFENLYAKNPDVKIIVGAPFYRDRWKWTGANNEFEDGLNSDERINKAGLYLRDYSEAILEVCAEYDIPAYNLYDISDINRFNEEYYLHDGLHPTDAGFKHLAGIFAQILLENK